MSNHKNKNNRSNKKVNEQLEIYNRVLRNVERVTNPVQGTLNMASNILPNIPLNVLEGLPINEMQQYLFTLNNNITIFSDQHREIISAHFQSPTQEFIEHSNYINTHFSNLELLRNIERISQIYHQILDDYPDMSTMLLGIDWDNFNPDEKDISEVKKIVDNKNQDLSLSEELEKTSSSISDILLSLFYILAFVASLYGRTQIYVSVLNNKVVPSIEKISTVEYNNKIKPLKNTIQNIDNIINKKLPHEYIGLIGIVIEGGLKIRERNRVNSKIKHKLKVKTVVQILNQKRNWIKISYVNSENKVTYEGWVFTRYIRKIK